MLDARGAGGNARRALLLPVAGQTLSLIHISTSSAVIRSSLISRGRLGGRRGVRTVSSQIL